MRRQTRKLLLNIATGIAVAMAATVVFLPATQAAQAQATANVNVRSGPGTNYRVVDTLVRGTSVEVGSCSRNFCEVRNRRTSGWVSASYLSRTGGNNGQPSVNFGFSVGPNGPSFSIGTGNQRPPVVRPVDRDVCFYDRSRYRGQRFCLSRGQSLRNLGDFANRISSIRNPAGLRVDVCARPRFRDCRTYTTSASNLRNFNNTIVSARVR
ncbi:SH3 domain-containing protein [Devosia rhodophyticola]|uniref:SH3 domain-containing protein n=1 Tax=Devosia rhodophyticola TaxID=3026423 RepID=A0ABY7YUU5_9HYPH|nr:SH3 domain-containing protein [Devosia rhodophyticola]WDR05133.1 SH3 domain-containing protein [Devosia rhodophyticola]